MSLYTQTGLHCLIIEVINTRVWFLDLLYTSLNSAHNNLEHGMAIVTETFSPLYLHYTTSFVKVQTRSDVTSHAIPFCHTHQERVRTGPSWLQPKLDHDVSSMSRKSNNCRELVNLNPFVQHGFCVLGTPKIIRSYINYIIYYLLNVSSEVFHWRIEYLDHRNRM